MKYANYIVLFVLLCTGLLLREHLHVSTNLLSLFASKESIEKISIANHLGYSKELLVVVKGFDKDSKIKVKEISKKLEKLDNILSVQSSIIPPDEIQQYFRKYYPLLASFDNSYKSDEEIKQSLQKLYDTQTKSIFYTPIDKNDPLKLFNLQIAKGVQAPHDGENIKLGEYGYLIRARTDVSPSQMKEAKVLYNEVHSVLDQYKDVKAFAPFFYTVENSTAIKADVQWIVILSSIILFIIYYLLIKNIKLLSHTLIALFSSMLFASIISTLVFRDFNILSLAFGMSITSVSIDYLLHYYFHNFYYSDKKIDKNVLYGFLTTIAAFGIFSFIPIPIISQISFFAVLSLFFAYLLFTFLFPYLSIKKYDSDDTFSSASTTKKIPAYIFTLLSVALLAYSAFNFKLDNNIRNLDYQNIKLQGIEQLLKKSNQNSYLPVLVQASTQEDLIHDLNLLQEKMPTTFSLASFVLDKESCLKKVHKLKDYDFNRINKIINKDAPVIGFKQDYFKNSYDFTSRLPACEVKDLDIFKSYNLSIYQMQGIYYTIALVKDVKMAQEFKFVTSIDVKEMFKKVADEMYKNLLLFSLIVLVVIAVLVIFSVKKRFLYAINYIIFPTSLVLGFLVTFYNVNLMHLFSLIILIAIGIDFGIYMSNTQKRSNTILAIKYSLLSTFAGFGVLVFSSITALNSIGIVISLGIVAVFIMIKAMK